MEPTKPARDRYAVIGNPIGHSRSPLIHASFAKATGQDIEYTAIESTRERFADDVRAFRASGGRGMNVTTPFKLQAFELADTRSERALQAGAANTLCFEGDRIIAENFDGVGLVTDIQRNLGFSLAGRRILMLGAGGAVRGALMPVLAEHPAELVIANRHAGAATALAAALAPAAVTQTVVRGCGFDEIGSRAFDLVINGTSASLGGELPAIDPRAFAATAMAYEMVYGRGLTPFLKLAQNAGVARLADGIGMLVEQAAEAFLRWRGVRPETRAVIAQLTVPLV
jgi:shikimate dehydrogenase